MEKDKLTMQTPDIMEENFKKLSALFPSAVTETIGDDGKARRTVDADVLRQLIDADVAEGREECYQFTWPDKAQSVLRACAPTRKTVRLDREKSVGRAEDGGAAKKQLDVDFVAARGSEKRYIQSAFAMPSSEKREQETRPLNAIGDSFKKIIVVSENIKPRRDEKGIVAVGLRNFLLDEGMTS